MTFKWPWPKVKAVALINKNFHDAVITTHSVTTKLDSYIILVMLITWLNCGWIMLETLLRILDFFIVKHTMGFTLGMVGLIDMKQRGIYWLDTGSFMWPWPLTLTLVYKRSNLISLCLRNGRTNWHGTKGIWINHSWPWLRPLFDHVGLRWCVG